MNELYLPPPPNWYKFLFECAPDNTVVYGCWKDIIIINPQDPSEPADIQKIVLAHGEKVTGLSINHGTWGNPNKHAATIGDDKIVRLWDLTSLTLKLFHKEHEKYDELLVGVSLVGDRIVSVGEKGMIVIWRISTNTATKLPDIFQQKVRVKTMSSCPHATWITAFGLVGGITVVADLRKGKVLYKMRGNDSDITGLSWCPLPINIYKTQEGIQIENIIKKKIMKRNVQETAEEVTMDEPVPTEITDSVVEKHDLDPEQESLAQLNNNTKSIQEKLYDLNISDDKDDILEVDIPKYNMDNRKRQVYQRVDKKNPWGDVTFSDTDTATVFKEYKDIKKSDFLKECEFLRNVIEYKDNIRTDKFEEKENSKIKEKDKHEQSDYAGFRTLTEKYDNRIESEAAGNKDFLHAEAIDESDTKIVSEDLEQLIEKEVPINRFISETAEKEYLLASAGVDGNVQIWRALTDGRLQLSLRAPVKSDKKGRNAHRIKWAVLCWAKPDILLISGAMNRLYCWNLLPSVDLNKRPTKETLFMPRLVHQDHSNQIFSINVPYKIYSQFEKTTSWNSLEDYFVWTFAKDKWILCTTLGTQRKTLVSYPCLSAGISCIAVSLIDPTKLALGLQDNTLRIWDLSIPHTQVIKMTKFMDNVPDKIMSVDWHPMKDNCLVYGTADGRITQFILNVKTRIEFSRFHRSSVNTIQWGPFPDKEDEFALYSCSLGDLIYHDGSEPTAEPNVINLDKDRAQTFAWKPDYSILAVGTKGGSVILLSKNLQIYETLYMQNKAVQRVSWHPESTVADSDRSPYANYLAVCTNDSVVFVYNCRSLEDNDAGKKSSLVAMLDGHINSVKWLSWCPQIGGRLASGSEDSVVLVWNVPSQTMLSTFKWDEILLCLIWSPVDADLIILAGKTHTIKIFRITKHPPIILEPETKKKTKTSPKVTENDDDNSTSSTIRIEKIKKLHILTTVTKLQSPEFGDSIATCKKILHMSEEASNEVEVDSDDSSSEESSKIAETQSAHFEPDAAQLFGTRKDMMNILNYEQKSHIRFSNWDQIHHISLWKGDLAKSIDSALESGAIEPWIINMAPMVSHSLWAKLCLKYAEKLAEDDRGLEASSYFLAVHQVHKAIDTLCNSNLYREALALAKSRLFEEDTVIKSVYERWASYSTYVGNYEVAAQCYIKLGRYSDAGVLLNKRAEPEKLELALELAKRSNNHDLEVAVNAKLELINQQKRQLCTADESETPTYPIIKISQSRFEAMMAASKKTEEEENTKSVSLENTEDIN